VGKEAVQDALELVHGRHLDLRRKQSSPVIRWHSVTCGVLEASPAIFSSWITARRLTLTFLKLGIPHAVIADYLGKRSG
jgi:hypothetical protein